MTEAEWSGCTNPCRMLHYLFCNCSDPVVRDYYSFETDLIESDGRLLEVTERKLRLYYSACCRRVFSLVPELKVHGLLDLAEQFADGLVTEEALATAQKSATAILKECRSAKHEVHTWLALALTSCLGE